MRKIFCLGFPLLSGLLLVRLVFLTNTAFAETKVPAVTLCVNPGGTLGCYASLQAAINVAPQGARIDVASGTYTEHVELGFDADIYGQGWDKTVINGNFTGPTPTLTLDWISASNIISGLALTGGGTGISNTSTNSGGCLDIEGSSPHIINTWLHDCTAYNGGGLSAVDSLLTLENVPSTNNQAKNDGGGYYIDGNGTLNAWANPLHGTDGMLLLNMAGEYGGGIYMHEVTATLGGLRVMLNTGREGGGIYIESDNHPVGLFLNQITWNNADNGGGIETINVNKLDLLGNLINGNTSINSGGGAYMSLSSGNIRLNVFDGNQAKTTYGGGVFITNPSSKFDLQDNTFQNNSATSGGGLYIAGSPAGSTTIFINANTFLTNTASTGAGLFLSYTPYITLTNNILARNVTTSSGHMGGGIKLDYAPIRIINNTIADNNGDGIFFSHSDGLVMINNIFSNNSPYGIQRDLTLSNTLFTEDYNDWFNNSMLNITITGPHDNYSNPLFVGSSGDLRAAYHLQANSPVTGTGSKPWAPNGDIDNQLRGMNHVSMGADEPPWPNLFLPQVVR